MNTHAQDSFQDNSRADKAANDNSKSQHIPGDEPTGFKSDTPPPDDKPKYVTGDLLRFEREFSSTFDAETFMRLHHRKGDLGYRPGADEQGYFWQCPNETAHADQSFDRPTSFYVINASDNADSGFEMGCPDPACAHLKRNDFLDQFCVKDKVTMEALESFVAPAEDENEDEDEADEDTVSIQDYIRSRVTGTRDPEQVSNVCRGILIGPPHPPLVIGNAIKLIASLSGFTETEVKAEFDRLRKSSEKIHEAKNSKSKHNDEEFDLEDAYEKRYNKRYVFIIQDKKHYVLRVPQSRDETYELYSPQAFFDLYLWDSYYYEDSSGKTRKGYVARAWYETEHRLNFPSGIGFFPDGKIHKGYWNEYCGLAFEPNKAGSWDKLKTHMLDNICQGDKVHYEWLMSWMAFKVQHPDKKPESAVVLIGEKGVGKSKLFEWYAEIFKPHAIIATQQEHITGRFNDHLRKALLLVCEESIWAGNHKDHGALKNLITGGKVQYEAKFKTAGQGESYTALAFISNEAWVVPASLRERRYFVLGVGDQRRGDTKYFGDIDLQMKSGGKEAMLAELLEWDFSKANLRKPIKTKWLVEQAEQSMEPHEAWIVEALRSGEFLSDCRRIELNWQDETEVSKDDALQLYWSYIDSSYPTGTKRKLSRVALGRALHALIPGLVSDRQKSDGSRPYFLPPAKDMQTHFEKDGLEFEPRKRAA
ncbi:energy-coupling factor transporter ATP-binding protein EcfA2 [Rhodoligotrophos appendicifer]|uniref:primase-helicase family protein n=1 Tax=Rhodoligotrophos appendicifer TaxID=987056 RepID=UPI00118576BB|nr:primase-helicase family protein [Rhodoligotrophos appendicifer]